MAPAASAPTFGCRPRTPRRSPTRWRTPRPASSRRSGSRSRRSGWAGRRPAPWTALLGPQATTLPVGLPDPAADQVGIAALVGVQSITASLPDAGAAESLVLRRLSQHVVTRASDLYLRLPEAGSGGDTLSAFLTSEQALLRHNAYTKGTPLVASYPTGAV